MVPINVNTQQARQRTWNGQDYTYSDNLSWIRGKHLWSFGGRVQKQDILHDHYDKVVGGLTTPLFFVPKGGGFTDLHGLYRFSLPESPTCPHTDLIFMTVSLP